MDHQAVCDKFKKVTQSIQTNLQSIQTNLDFLCECYREQYREMYGHEHEGLLLSSNQIELLNKEGYTPDSEKKEVKVTKSSGFPDFDDSNPQEWLCQANQYFENHSKDEWAKVRHASFYLVGVADLWYIENLEGKQPVNWDYFSNLLLKHFSVVEIDDEDDMPHVSNDSSSEVVDIMESEYDKPEIARAIVSPDIEEVYVLAVEKEPQFETNVKHHDYENGTQVHFKSVKLNKYLCAENGGGSVLVDNHNTPRNWETFRLWRIDETTFNFRVLNKDFIGVDSQGEGVKLFAQANGPWIIESFKIIRNGNNPFRVCIQASNDIFFQAETENSVTTYYLGSVDERGYEDPSVYEMHIIKSIQGEYQLTNGYGPDQAPEILRNHWSTYIVEDDFRFIFENSLNAARIPVGWRMKYDSSPPRPFVGGSSQALDDAFTWAIAYNIKVILDLHAALGSQSSNRVEPELNPKWVNLLTMVKACLSTISIENTTGTRRKAGGHIKKKLRDLGGLDAVFEVARKCHSIMEEWLQESPNYARDLNDSSRLENLIVILKFLRIMESATFLSYNNQSHLLEMKGNYNGERTPRSFTKLILSVIKVLSGTDIGTTEDIQGPFAFDEEEFEPSKWDLLSGKVRKFLSQESRATVSDHKYGNLHVLSLRQQESIKTENLHSHEGSCSSSVDEEKSILLADCLLTAVKVIMNLTNENAEGCRQIAACGGLEILSSLIAGHFPIFSSTLPHLRDTSLLTKSSSTIDKQTNTRLTDQELDFLVVVLGLFVNLVEKDGHNRYRLANEEKIDEISVWYVMDELGSALRHSDEANFRVSPFLYMADGKLESAASYSILWPTKTAQNGDECSREFLFGIGEEKQSSAMVTAWFYIPQNYFVREYEKYSMKLRSTKFFPLPVKPPTVANSLHCSDGSQLHVYTDIHHTHPDYFSQLNQGMLI